METQEELVRNDRPLQRQIPHINNHQSINQDKKLYHQVQKTSTLIAKSMKSILTHSPLLLKMFFLISSPRYDSRVSRATKSSGKL